MKQSIEKELLTAEELGEALGFATRTIQQWTRDRKISVLKLSPTCYRYHLATVLADLKTSEVPAKGRRNHG